GRALRAGSRRRVRRCALALVPLGDGALRARHRSCRARPATRAGARAMKSVHLLALYLGVGLVAAFVVARRHAGPAPSRLGSALVAWLLWPLWAPVALGPTSAPRAERDPLARRLHAALDDALEA